MQSTIFANGKFTAKEMAVEKSEESDLIIAVDGGLAHCFALNINPHVLIGDLDSVPPELARRFSETGAEVIIHPKDKDKTDLELALDLSVGRGVKEINLFATLGNRWDMSLANLLLAAAPSYMEIRITLFADHTTIYLLRDGDRKEILPKNGRRMSLIPIQNDIQVTLHGFKYPLTKGIIAYSSTYGISNSLTGDKGVIIVEKGVLLCVQSKETETSSGS